jgi:hypothetical protein
LVLALAIDARRHHHRHSSSYRRIKNIIHKNNADKIRHHVTKSSLVNSITKIRRNKKNWNPFANEKFDPARAPMDEYLTHFGYPVKKYEITTEDGYILTAFRF